MVHAITRMYEHLESYLVKCKALSKPGTLFIYFPKPSSLSTTLWKGCEILKIIKKSQVINFKGIFVMVKFSDSNLLILKTVTVSYNKMKHSMTKRGPSTSRTIVKGSD